MFDCEKYEKECQIIREGNDGLLNLFAEDMEKHGLKKNTLKTLESRVRTLDLVLGATPKLCAYESIKKMQANFAMWESTDWQFFAERRVGGSIFLS